MIRRITIAIVTLCTLGLAYTAVGAHEGHDHTLMGTVTRAAADRLTLEDRDGKAVTVKVTKDTKVKPRATLKVAQIEPGTRIVITATQAKDQTFTAKTIEVGVTRPPSK